MKTPQKGMPLAGVALLLLTSVVLVSGCATYQHPDFKGRHARISSVAILPASLDVYRVTFKGDKDPMHAESTEASLVMAQEISTQLQKRGYLVHPFDAAEEALSGNPEIRTAWHTSSSLFKKTLGDIQKRTKGKGPYSVGGEEINLLADYAQADSLIFAIGEGVKKTGGEVAKEVLLWALLGTPIRPNEALTQLALVDGNTGEVLWLHKNSNVAINPAVPDQVRSMVRDILGPLPKSAFKQKREKSKRKSRPDPAAAASPEAPRGFGSGAPAAPTTSR